MQKEVSNIIRDLKDKRIDIMTSVTEVIVTRDLKYATVYISALDEETSKTTLEGLKSASSFIRRELASRLNLRNTPELRFLADNSLAYGMKMDKLISEVIKKDREN